MLIAALAIIGLIAGYRLPAAIGTASALKRKATQAIEALKFIEEH